MGLKLYIGAMVAFVSLFVAAGFLVTHPVFKYSDGQMISSSAKFSKKGFVFKTYEGYTLVGSASDGIAEKWTYSVRKTDTDVIECIQNHKEVKLKYNEYVFVPFTIGDSHHIVYSCEPFKDEK